MIFSATKTVISQISVEEIPQSKLIVAYMSLEEFRQSREALGISETVMAQCERNIAYSKMGLDSFDNHSFGLIVIPESVHSEGHNDIIGLFLNEKMIIFIVIDDVDSSTKDIFNDAIERSKHNITQEKIIYNILDCLMFDMNDAPETAQKAINVLESSIINHKPYQNMNAVLFDLKNDMLLLKNYYDYLVDFGDTLSANSNEIIDGENLRYLAVFTQMAKRMNDNAQTIFDDIIHIREAYEAEINNNMNKTMKLFTVLSAIFLPLTLLVGWYGMNFTSMPELRWKYGYITVISVSVIIVIACLAIFKKKKFFK